MKINLSVALITICVLLLAASFICIPRAKNIDLDQIKLPDGFQISVYASDVKNARQMARSPEGVLYVGTRTAGNVYALVDDDNDYKIDRQYTLATGLNMPNGVAFRNGDLYVAEIGRILRFDNIEDHLEAPPSPTVVTDAYPDKAHHGWKYIAFGPDGKLYIPVGAPCNLCEPTDSIFSTLTRINASGSNLEIVAKGIRNTVGFDWHPKTKTLFFTDNGRDWMGDDTPPDELNKITHEGQHFGYPYCHGGDIKDPKFGEGKDCGNYEAPVQNLGPHVAALGMKFLEGDMFPEKYRNTAFIAEHGSWNRTTPIGYRISMVPLDENHHSAGYEIFAEGWLAGSVKMGRPVDILELPDGSILVSDDHADVIYRITYEKDTVK